MGLWITSQHDSIWSTFLSQDDPVSAVRHLPNEPSIVIVPTGRQQEVLLRAWAMHHGQGEPPIIETMAAFVRRLGMHVLQAGPVIMGEDKVDVLIQQVVVQGSMLASIGLEAQKLVRWTQYGVSPDDVDDLADKAGIHTRRGRMLAEIGSAWRKLRHLYGGMACDRGIYELLVRDSLKQLTERPLRTTSGDVIASCVMIATHGVTTADKELLAELSTQGWDVGVGFASEHPAMARLGAVISASVTDAAWYVTNGWHQGETAQTPADVDIHVAALPSREEEVRRVLGAIKEDIAAGVSMRDIGVCIPGASVYRQIIEDLARRAGVPLEAEQRVPIASTHQATALRTICIAAVNGWTSEDLERVLTHVQIRQRIPNATDVLAVARRERIRGGGGPAEWLRRLDEIASSCKQILDERPHADDTYVIERRLRQILRAAAAVHNLADIIPMVPQKPLTAGEFKGLLVALIDESGSDKLLECLEEYVGLAERHDLTSASFDRHLELWWSLVRAAGSQIDRRSGAGIAVVAPAELRCRTWERLYVLGMVEGEFPRVQEHIADREIIPGVLERMYQQGMVDIMMSVRASGRLVFTRPTHIDGAAALTSSLLDAIDHASVKPLPDVFRKETAVAIQRHDLRTGTDGKVYRLPQRANVHAVQGADLRERIEAELARPVSPSRLDLYSQCPYKFYAEKILRLGQVEVSETRLSPLERGTMLHDVAAEFFRRQQPTSTYADISSLNDLLAFSVRLAPEREDEYWNMLKEIAHERMRTHEWAHAYADIDQHVLFGTEERPGLLRQWLLLEIAYQETTQHYPTLLELPIETRIAMNADGPLSDVRVTARVDRIDIAHRDGVVTFIVNDYKARVSSGYTLAEIMSGKLSQMPIYLETARTWLAEHNISAAPWAALYRSFGTVLHTADDPMNKIAMKDPAMSLPAEAVGIKQPRWIGVVKEFAEKPLAEQNQELLQVVGGVVAGVYDGVFAVRPTHKACELCSVGELCRIEQWGQG
jgi:hypothetical protein